jgi:hypothetical protein
MRAEASSVFWEITAERVDEYVAKGGKRRHFFPHRVYHLPKCGPDGFRLASRMCGRSDPAEMWQLLLYVDQPLLATFPLDFYFDDDLIWHRQQFGRPGQVASANIALADGTVYTSGQLSDLAQRISRRREHKTKVSKHFRGWSHILLNAILSMADQLGARQVRSPTAGLAMRHTDVKRRANLGPELFERVYDRTVNDLFPAHREGGWWVIDVAEARARVVTPERRTEPHRRTKTICICHDIEGGAGHVDVDPSFARRAERTAPGDLVAIRQIEAEVGVRTTYFVLGSLLSERRDGLESEGHALGFHSFDHRFDREDQLHRCREVDYRIKGYRPPNSIITAELTDRNLLFHNFEWLASSPKSLGVTCPEMRAGLVRLPIADDDYALYRSRLPYGEWEKRVLDRIAERDFYAISLHDCYAPYWLPHYRNFLERVREMGELRTLDEVAAEVTLCSAA